MKKILVTGSNGQLGRAINQQYKEYSEIEIVNTDIQDLDITNIDKTVEFVKNIKPYAIINCAAHTDVNACESDIENAYKINAIGPRNLSIGATQVGAKIIHISTDYVFDGTSKSPYIEYDTPNPQSVYGKSKLEGENYVKAFSDQYFIIRTAWLYGEGKNFVKTMLKLSETNDKVRVVGDQYGTPTSAVELAKMITYLLPTYNYGIFHGTCEGSCNWAEFAETIFKLAGKSTKVEKITTAEYPTPAVRPQYGVLENNMLQLTTDFKFAHWEDAIKSYMDSI